MLNREFYFDNSHERYNNRRAHNRKKQEKPCPRNCGRLLEWNKLEGYFECNSCGYHSQKQKFEPQLESLGALWIVSADGFGAPVDNNTGAEAASSKPRISAKFGPRNSEVLENYSKTAEIRGDPELERWLAKQSLGTWLVDYKES